MSINGILKAVILPATVASALGATPRPVKAEVLNIAHSPSAAVQVMAGQARPG